MGGRWAVGELTRRRFAAFMEVTYGVHRPEIVSAPNAVTYGDHAVEASD
jgi:hypothetical protein